MIEVNANNIQYILDNFIKLDMYEDQYHNTLSQKVIDEPHKIFKKNNEYIVYLNQIPDKDATVTVKGKLDSNSSVLPDVVDYVQATALPLTTVNQFYFDKDGSRLYFKDRLDGTDILVTYSAIGKASISANMIYTEWDSNGNILELLGELVRETRIALDRLCTISDAEALKIQLESQIKTLIEIFNIIKNDVPLAQQLSAELSEKVAQANIAKTSIDESVANAQTIVNAINMTGNDSKQITTAMWGDKKTDGHYHYTWTHTMASSEIEMTCYSVTANGREGSLIKPIIKDNANIEFISDVNTEAVIVASARAWSGTVASLSAFNSDQLAEGITHKFVTATQLAQLADIVNKQNKTDDGLHTIDKSIVGGMNEIKAVVDSTQLLSANVNSKAFSPQDKFLQQFARKMHDKLTVIIECWGDSTYFGALSRSATATRPAPNIMQDLLRGYFSNDNITVINKGTSGQATWNIIDAWEADMTNSTADIIYINYGINNMWQDVNKLKQDLTTMITIARKHNKEVVLDCPNVVLNLNPQGEVDENNFPYGGNPTHCYAVMEHAQVTRDLARDLGVCFIDNYELTQQFNYHNNDITVGSADGMHPSQELYFKKASNMCIPFIAPSCAKVRDGDSIPALDSSIITTNYSMENNSKSKSIAVGNKVCCSFFCEDNGLDMAFAVISKGTSATSIGINLDGEYISTFTPKLLGTGTTYLVDNEFVALKGLTRGLHVVQLTAGENEYVELNYIKFYKSIKQSTGILKYNKDIISTNLQANTMTDIITDNFLDNLDISFKCKMHDKKGISIFTNKCGTNIYGITLYINDGYIAFAEYNQDGYAGNALLNPDTNYKDVEHIYRFKMDKGSRILNIYCDDVLLKTTTVAQNYLGGYVGIFSLSSADFKVEIEKLI